MKKNLATVTVMLSLLTLALVAGILANHATYGARYTRTNARRSLLKALGAASLSLSYECPSANNPSEGAYGCLSDIPGGYPYYQSFDVAGFPRDVHE
jgi:hypothetical protein